MDPLTLLPKPEFAANIDTANEQIVRLTDQYNAVVGPEGRLTKAETEVTTLNASVTKLTETNTSLVGELATAKAAVTAAQEAQATAEKAEKAAAATAQTAIAAAGITVPANVQGTDALNDDKLKVKSGATGLQRAMEANIALHAAKK